MFHEESKGMSQRFLTKEEKDRLVRFFEILMAVDMRQKNEKKLSTLRKRLIRALKFIKRHRAVAI